MISLWKIIVSEDMLGGYFHNYKVDDSKIPHFFFHLFDIQTEVKLLISYWHPEERNDKNFVILRNTKMRDKRFNFFAGIETDYDFMDRKDFEVQIEKYLQINLEQFSNFNKIEISDEEFIDYLSFHTEPEWSVDKLLFDYYERFIRLKKKNHKNYKYD